MFELREGSCLPRVLVCLNVFVALVDAIIAVLAFYQLMRIHSRNSQVVWTRQKVCHLMIGSSSMGMQIIQFSPTLFSVHILSLFFFFLIPWHFPLLFKGNFIYFVLALVAACKDWPCWSNSCGFILMALPRILFFAVFLLLLSFWVDLCHQANDEDEEYEESSSQEALLDKNLNKSSPSRMDGHRKCFPLRCLHVGSHQKIVIAVIVLVFGVMMACALIIWMGMGKNPINSAVVARVYVDFFAIAILILGGALAYYGLVLCLKMSKVRSEQASSEKWKFAGLAVVSVLCFTSSSFVALLTDIPMLYHWPQHRSNVVCASLLMLVYYFIGSSMPSAFILWTMRELPTSVSAKPREASTIAFVADSSAVVQNPQRWTAATHNQTSRGSPI